MQRFDPSLTQFNNFEKSEEESIITVVNANLMISYGIPVPGEVYLAIYDATGSLVRSITHTHLKPRFYQEMITSNDLSSGIYFVVLKQNNEQVSKKFLLIK